MRVLPRTADTVVENDTGLEDTSAPGNFWDKVKALLTNLLRKYLQFSHLPKSAVKPVVGTLPFRVLFGALFSASAVKNGLLDETFIYAFPRYGLQLPASGTFEDRQVVGKIAAVWSCLQLITSVFVEKLAKTDSLADIIAALEALRVKNAISLPRELELLDVSLFKLSSSC
jgi:hypothetical protein